LSGRFFGAVYPLDIASILRDVIARHSEKQALLEPLARHGAHRREHARICDAAPFELFNDLRYCAWVSPTPSPRQTSAFCSPKTLKTGGIIRN
jgi:hypothetical protein